MVNRGEQGKLIPESPPSSGPVALDPPRPKPERREEPKAAPGPEKLKIQEKPKKKVKEKTQEEKMEELQKLEDDDFMKGYPGLSLNDLIMKGFLEHTVKITDNFEVKLRSLKKKEELDIKRRIATYDGVQMYVLDQVNVDTLCYALMEINGAVLADTFESEEDFETKKGKIENLPEAIVLEILEEFQRLNRALVILIKGSSKNSLARRLLGQEFA